MLNRTAKTEREGRTRRAAGIEKYNSNVDRRTSQNGPLIFSAFIAVVVFPIASAVYTWVATRNKDNTVHIKAVEEALRQRLDHPSAVVREHVAWALARLSSRAAQTQI